MGKPNKTQTIGFRATYAERRIIKNQANVLKMRLSEYIRLCVLSDIGSRGRAAQEQAK